MHPSRGDTCLTCGHVVKGHMHFSVFREPIKFMRPAGTMASAKWLAVCDKCQDKIRFGTPYQTLVRGDFVLEEDIDIDGGSRSNPKKLSWDVVDAVNLLITRAIPFALLHVGRFLTDETDESADRLGIKLAKLRPITKLAKANQAYNLLGELRDAIRDLSWSDDIELKITIGELKKATPQLILDRLVEIGRNWLRVHYHTIGGIALPDPQERANLRDFERLIHNTAEASDDMSQLVLDFMELPPFGNKRPTAVLWEILREFEESR